ncbi:hypothetical protein D3C81_2174080 [compost metagenome]
MPPDLFETISTSPSAPSNQLFSTTVFEADRESELVPTRRVSPPLDPRFGRGPK